MMDKYNYENNAATDDLTIPEAIPFNIDIIVEEVSSLSLSKYPRKLPFL